MIRDVLLREASRAFLALELGGRGRVAFSRLRRPGTARARGQRRRRVRDRERRIVYEVRSRLELIRSGCSVLRGRTNGRAFQPPRSRTPLDEATPPSSSSDRRVSTLDGEGGGAATW